MKVITSTTTTKVEIEFTELETVLKEKGLIAERQKLIRIGLSPCGIKMILVEETFSQDDVPFIIAESQRVFNGEQQKILEEKSLEDLELPLHTYNSIKSAKINTLRELVHFSDEDLLKFKRIRQKTVIRVKGSLAKLGLDLAATGGMGDGE